MRVALAQINSVVGDFSANKQKILTSTEQAHEHNCDLVIFPELALFGYGANDLLERSDVVDAQIKTLNQLLKTKTHVPAVFGAVTHASKGLGKPYFNSAVVTGKKATYLHKELLPSYDVFDESRFFRPGKVADHVVKIGKHKILILVCEDMWAWERSDYKNPLTSLKKQKLDFVVSINASPFCLGKRERRLKMASATAKLLKCPVLYVNRVGGQDEVIFDGGSFAVDAQGKLITQSSYFQEDFTVVELGKTKQTQNRQHSNKVPRSATEFLKESLVLGIKDFAAKNNLKKIHLGLSGGIDSAVALCLAVDALGAKNVTALALPGPYSEDQSLVLAKKLAQNVGCDFQSISINSIYEEQVRVFESTFGKQTFGLLHENLQARIRGGILMMFSNLQNSLLLATSNKSEMATGYATLYGDMCGGLAPLGDLLKKQVYAIAELYNTDSEVIPKTIITRAPSAELRPNQKDQDSLPPYDDLDASVENIVTLSKTPKSPTDHWLLKKIAASEFKRWQAPPVLRVSEHAFGRGRRWPISHGAYKN